MHFFQLELYTNFKMFYSSQWFENVQMHLRELMHLCITLNKYITSATFTNITFLPVDSMHFPVHCGIKKLNMALVRVCSFTAQPTIRLAHRSKPPILLEVLSSRPFLTTSSFQGFVYAVLPL